MWSHYADKHRGVAIGFRIIKNDELFQVSYTKPKEKRPTLDLTSDQNTNEKLFLDLAKIKYQKWEYEEEHKASCRNQKLPFALIV